jgi:hypothetical protein
VARKARKYREQGGRLALPALELAYLFSAIAHAPGAVITSKMLPVVDTLLEKLRNHDQNPSTYEMGNGYWDDYCLARFLEGVCLRFVAYPVSSCTES